MDCAKVGALILQLRREMRLTQRQLAERLHISAKTVSKWERGQGCPDVSLLRELSGVLNVNIEKILAGELNANRPDGGNMKKLKFYVCPDCGNLLTATGEAEITCCGRRLFPLEPRPAEGEHRLHIEPVEDEWYITSPHEMSKAHHLRFVAYLRGDSLQLVRLYPEQDCALRLPRLRGGTLYFCCSRHGLWVQR